MCFDLFFYCDIDLEVSYFDSVLIFFSKMWQNFRNDKKNQNTIKNYRSKSKTLSKKDQNATDFPFKKRSKMRAEKQEIRQMRNGMLWRTDSTANAADAPADLKAGVTELRQKLRDLPEALKDIDDIFVPSSFPSTKILEQK